MMSHSLKWPLSESLAGRRIKIPPVYEYVVVGTSDIFLPVRTLFSHKQTGGSFLKKGHYTFNWHGSKPLTELLLLLYPERESYVGHVFAIRLQRNDFLFLTH